MARAIRRVMGGSLIRHPPCLEVATVAAAGNNQSTAAPLASTVNYVTGADGSKGVRLPKLDRLGVAFVVYNCQSGQGLKVYPASGQAINNATDTAFTVAGLTGYWFIGVSANNWAAIGGTS